MGCIPCKPRRHNIKSVRQTARDDDHDEVQGSPAHELTNITNINSSSFDELANAQSERADDVVLKNVSKIPGIVEDTQRDEDSPLIIPSSSSNNNLAAASSTLFSLETDQTDEDLQHAAVLQAVVRAYVMRKARLKEENTPFTEWMVSNPMINFEDDPALLIPQVPGFRSHLFPPPSSSSSQPLTYQQSLLKPLPPHPRPQHLTIPIHQPSLSLHSPTSPTGLQFPFHNPMRESSTSLLSLSSTPPPPSPSFPQALQRYPTKPLLANSVRHVQS